MEIDPSNAQSQVPPCMDTIPSKKRLNSRCTQCRRRKVKCTPENRKWPQRCDRCIKANLECSAGTVLKNEFHTMSNEDSNFLKGPPQMFDELSAFPPQATIEAESAATFSSSSFGNARLGNLPPVGQAYAAFQPTTRPDQESQQFQNPGFGALPERVYTESDSEDEVEPEKLTSANIVPPELPPSVEAAYRLKCIQLKTRLNEVEESNNEAHLRVERINRAIYKGRLERAMLLEQLEKRTSTNVEDSEGSPSPPPTPKEKPLRTKRGHRKPDFLTTDMDGRAGATFINQGPVTLSPSSDAFSHTHPDQFRNSTPQGPPFKPTYPTMLPRNGTAAPPYPSQPFQDYRPRNPFDVYCEENRPVLLAQRPDLHPDDGEVGSQLARGWAHANNETRAEYSAKFESLRRAVEGEHENGNANGSRLPVIEGEQRVVEAETEDVEMGDDSETAAAFPATGGGGFTAVNN